MSNRSCAAIVNNGRILMVKQTYKGEQLWTLPGGSIEAGESPAAAAVREAREETGLEIEVVKLLVETYSDRIKGTYYCYQGRIVSGTARLGTDPELADNEQQLQELRWVPLADARDHQEIRRIEGLLEGVVEENGEQSAPVPVQIREASPADTEGIAEVHVRSWQTTYRGIIADDFLAGLSVEKRKKNWEWVFRNLNQDEAVFLALDDKGQIAGFCSGGKCRELGGDYDGELYAIYLLREYQGTGIGRKLAGHLVRHLKANGYKAMMVWVLERNPAVDFYKRLGAKPFTRKEIRIGDEVLIEIGLGWESIDVVQI